MPKFTQANRPMRISTPLGQDVLLLRGFDGEEGISRLFCFSLDLFAENGAVIAFDKLLGQKVTITFVLPEDNERHFNGIIRRISRSSRGEEFTGYHAEMVPQFWLLTKRQQSRIFQKMTVPNILKKVLESIDTAFEIQGSYPQRDFCVQYRETDYAFACRLMEEEGIYYFFKHTADGHKMVVADTPQSHPELPFDPDIIYEEVTGENREDMRITRWEKEQELRSGKSTLWDHTFHLPHRHLEAKQPTQDSVPAGRESHKLKLGPNDPLEIYDWPGGYAKRFDSESGHEAEGKRTVGIRMQQEEYPALVIHGKSDCRHLNPGFKFTLERHFSDNGVYVLTWLRHGAMQGEMFRSSHEPGELKYQNEFNCIPLALPFRPPMVTPRPMVQGTQTAVVVGPGGEEIYTDEFGRVKVQFHWDREGKSDENSSCWIRVSQSWAGKRWGSMAIPRIGQEVVVDFLEGDPDRPLIVGRVYNADQMPPYALPGERTKSTIKSMSSKGGGGFNEIRFEDKKGKEEVFHHAEKDLHIRVKNDRHETILRDRHLTVTRDKFANVNRDGHTDISRDRIEKIGRDHHLEIAGKEAIKITGSHSLKVQGNVIEEFTGNQSTQVTQNVYVKGMQVVIEAALGITLKVGGNFITIDPSGVAVKGILIQLNSAGAALSGSPGSLVSPLSPTAAVEAVKAEPGEVTSPVTGQGATPAAALAATAAATPAAMTPARLSPASNAPTHNPNSPENKPKKHWIEIELVDEEGNPVPGEPYQVTLPDGTTVADGTLDDKGFARVDNIDPGSCKVTFPNLDKDAWQPK